MSKSDQELIQESIARARKIAGNDWNSLDIEKPQNLLPAAILIAITQQTEEIKALRNDLGALSEALSKITESLAHLSKDKA